MKKSNFPFHVLIKPIGPVCNIACEYCFYLGKEILFPYKQNRYFRMSEVTLETFVKQYVNGQPFGTTDINFTWQGGEPTLRGIDFYKKAIDFQNKYRRKEMKITNAFQTNGILLNNDWAKFFKDNNFLIGISIDGPEKLHNRFRKDHYGVGTFSSVMAGLDALRKYQVDFNTLTAVQSDNGDHPREVYNFLKSIGSIFMQFIPIVEPEEKGGVSYRTVSPQQWGNFLNTIFDLWIKQDLGRIFVQHFEITVGIYAGYPSSLCVHSPVCGRAVVLEHNGNLYSCDHFVFRENLLGNIHSTTLTNMVDSDFEKSFGLNKIKSLSLICKECPYLKLCYGGCPSNRLRKTPSGETGLNWICEGYKMFYSHTKPVFTAISECIRHRVLITEYKLLLTNRYETS
ncbi:MAG: anaerobic sulfatase maturase [Atribacterota bacterium]|nr:anaerobic sulfatase maturase [Atribacterota bacterium]